ncbi:VOC family protein [Streptomyces pratensis]|nr:VOC family protein [Streptomyces pratensis]
MIRWTYAFLDRPAATVDRATAFWASVTDTRASEPWGDEGEFTSLVAEGADTCLVTQAVGGPGGAHPDLAVEDMTAFTGRATELGAVVRARRPELTVLRSPAGQPFCLVPWRGQRSVPPVVTGPGGVRSRADQISLDVSPDAFEAEVGFWVELTGWDASPGEHAEFHVLRRAVGLPVHLIVQRLDAPRPASAHLDVACPDLEAGRTWHEAHGAEFVGRGDAWLVMRDPSGGVYCLTRRDPETGE